ncbi:MAG: histidine triad nucleotide-binding protein [Dehalococcoidia bacterium]
MTVQDCIFCKIGAGDIPSEKVYEDDAVFAIRDINPRAPVHLLVIPYAHVGALADEAQEAIALAARCVSAAPGIARDAGVDADGYRLVANQGADAGQEVPHFHLHILGGRPLAAMG